MVFDQRISYVQCVTFSLLLVMSLRLGVVRAGTLPMFFSNHWLSQDAYIYGPILMACHMRHERQCLHIEHSNYQIKTTVHTYSLKFAKLINLLTIPITQNLVQFSSRTYLIKNSSR